MVLKIKVRCPFCSAERVTRSLKVIECFKCSRKFKVFCKDRPSRIVRIEEGDIKELHKQYWDMKHK